MWHDFTVWIGLKGFSSGIFSRPSLNGIVEDDLRSEATAESLSNMLDSILSDCRAAYNVSVTYYTTDAPYQPKTIHDLAELLSLFGAFRSKTINSGQDIPVEVLLFYYLFWSYYK